jgi:hypothetical protein
MTDLSNTARLVLPAAAQRDDLSALPFPEGCRAKGGAEERVLTSLKKRGLIRVIGSKGGPERAIITSEGMAAIGPGSEDKMPGGVSKEDSSPTLAEAGVQAVEALARAAAASTKVPSKQSQLRSEGGEARYCRTGCETRQNGGSGVQGYRVIRTVRASYRSRGMPGSHRPGKLVPRSGYGVVPPSRKVAIVRAPSPATFSPLSAASATCRTARARPPNRLAGPEDTQVGQYPRSDLPEWTIRPTYGFA